jgi:hypothetical protein
MVARAKDLSAAPEPSITDVVDLGVRLLESVRAAWGAGVPLLSASGADLVRELVIDLYANLAAVAVPTTTGQFVPRWDGRCLWLGDRLVKEFKRAAPGQVAILDAFEQAGWPAHLAHNSLRGRVRRKQEGKRRLHDTLQNLKRSLAPGTIQFHGDGSGSGVWWGLCIGTAWTDRPQVNGKCGTGRI